MDDVDRSLLGLLLDDADQTYAELGAAVHLSAPATHERVRKMRASGVIRRTTIEVDPAALDRETLVFALVESGSWCGGEETTNALMAIEGIEAAYAIAGKACILVKIRVDKPKSLQNVLGQIYAIDGAVGTESIVVLDTLFERPMSVRDLNEVMANSPG